MHSAHTIQKGEYVRKKASAHRLDGSAAAHRGREDAAPACLRGAEGADAVRALDRRAGAIAAGGRERESGGDKKLGGVI